MRSKVSNICVSPFKNTNILEFDLNTWPYNGIYVEQISILLLYVYITDMEKIL